MGARERKREREKTAANAFGEKATEKKKKKNNERNSSKGKWEMVIG